MISIRPYYDAKRPSRSQLWGVYVDAVCIVITRRYPGFVTKD